MRSSKNIFVGRVLDRVDEDHAKIEIVKVLRGALHIGTHATVVMWRSEESIGKIFIFSDPDSFPPYFEVLPEEYQEEVLFLISLGEEPDEDSDSTYSEVARYAKAIDSVEQAIVRAQGLSCVSHDVGLSFLLAQEEFPSGKILSSIIPLRTRVLTEKDPSWVDEYRLHCLVEALLQKDNHESRAFAMQEVLEYTKFPQADVDWSHLPYKPTPRATLLSAVLGFSKGDRHSAEFAYFQVGKHEPLHELLALERETLLKSLPDLKGLSLVDVVYALVDAGVVAPAEILKRLGIAESRARAAVGFHLAACGEARCWSWKEALSLWDQALPLLDHPEARKAVQAEMTKIKEKKLIPPGPPPTTQNGADVESPP